MGEVFLAEDERLERKVALKFLPGVVAADPRALERFHREARAAAAVSHPNIITVHEVGVYDDRPYIAMAYVEGTTLREHLQTRRLSVGKSVDIASQTCEGLAEAHRNGVVHRDIKPANIHLDHSGRVRILDFGLALRPHLAKITQEQVAVGTVEYMSPEQATGANVDERSDIFSLGNVLYEMLTGRMPFEGPHTAAVIFAITTLDPVPVRQLNPAVSPELAAVVERAMQKDPAKRFQTARDMQLALRAAGGAEARVERIKRRHRRTIIRTTAVIAVGVAAVVIYRHVHDWIPFPNKNDYIAVLPFENISNDPEQQYFVDGMTEAITTRLAQIDKLFVISRTSAMHYQKTDKTIKEIARELDVSKIVEGSVTRYGNQVRITAQLIDAEKDKHLWAQDYKADDVNDLIDVQSRIATDIAEQVSVHVKPEQQARMDPVPPRHAEALELYLQGRSHFNRRMPADITAALEYFNQAIALDSTFAQAFAGIADCYTVRAMWNWDSSRNTFPRARYASDRALQLDPMLAEAHASRAMVQLYYDWDWKAAEASFKTAIGISPNYATAYHWYGLSLMSLGRYGDAIHKMEQAVRLDPFSPIMLVTLSQCYDLNGDYEKAATALERAFAVFPDFGYAWLAKSWVAFHQQRYPEATNCARTAMRHHVDRSEVMLVAGLDGMGQRSRADSVLAAAVARPGQEWHVRAALYAYHGMPDSALANAQRAIDNREWFVVAFRSRWLEPMHHDKRFDEMLKTRAPIRGVDD